MRGSNGPHEMIGNMLQIDIAGIVLIDIILDENFSYVYYILTQK